MKEKKIMSNELTTEKFGFKDRVKMAFGAKGLIEQANEAIEQAQKQMEEAQKKSEKIATREAEVRKEEASIRSERQQLESEKLKVEDMMAEAKRMMSEAEEMKKEANAMMKKSENIVQKANLGKEEAIERAKQEAEAKVSAIITEHKEAGEITQGKGEIGAQMTLFFKKQIVDEKMKLDTTLSELEEVGAPKELKEKLVQTYQAKLLGVLYAYMAYDRLTSREALSIIKKQVQESIANLCGKSEELSETLQTGFVDGYIHTRYSNSNYEEKDWKRYVEGNKGFFQGKGDFIRQKTMGKIIPSEKIFQMLDLYYMQKA